MVGINEVDPGELVLHQHLAGAKGWRGKIVFDFERMSVSRFANDGGLVRGSRIMIISGMGVCEVPRVGRERVECKGGGDVPS